MKSEAMSNYNPFLSPEQNAQRGVIVVSENEVRSEKLISIIPQAMAGTILSTETHTKGAKSKLEF